MTRPLHPLVVLLLNTLAGIALGLVVLAGLAYAARDDIAAWYRQLPVGVMAKCPGVQ